MSFEAAFALSWRHLGEWNLQVMQSAHADQISERPPRSLSGLRILVVEDEFMIADMLAAMLEDLGCVVVGPFAETRGGLHAIESKSLDGAVLDANLGGGATSAPVARALHAAALPFVVSTGYGCLRLSDEVLERAPRLQKPFNEQQLQAALISAFMAPPATHPSL